VASVREVIELANEVFGRGYIKYEDDYSGVHESAILSLETSKARSVLSVMPRWGLKQSVSRTLAWYQAYQTGSNARDLCLKEIDDYEKNR